MNSTEQNQPQPRKETPLSSAVPPAPRSDSRSFKDARPAAAAQRAGAGPRFWALPDKHRGWWILLENDVGGATELIEGTPVIFAPELSLDQKAVAAERCREFIAGRLRDRSQEDLFNLIKRMLLGGMLILGGLIGLRVLESFDIVLLLGALGYTGYAGIRYGGRLLRSMEAANRPYAQFIGEPFQVSPLAERIARALEFRRKLSPEKRGESPDEELLDANAYRKLISEGVITRDELCALGRAVEQRLNVKFDRRKKLSDLTRAENFDGESAAFYRDLALAAAEIAYDAEFNG